MTVTNNEIARAFDEVATLLEEQGANLFRIDAYRRGAYTLRHLDRPVEDILEREGLEGLQALPGIGEALARAIREYVTTGKLGMLERLRGEVEPQSLLASVPGIGKRLAERLHEELGIETLEELEAAAHDGRLERFNGFGPKRLAGIRAALAQRLGRYRRTRPPHVAPPVDEILDVDREYRQRARAGKLRTIAPRRFNPSGEAWLPVLHTRRGDHEYTALFSNTERAHRLGRTRDWVVIYFDGGANEGQCTVVTAQRGPLKGKRVVRGREDECLAYYQRAGHAKA
ncbi:MAG: helix-hairpin-helix domain-containing protein [Dehalococcoidia bacterium]